MTPAVSMPSSSAPATTGSPARRISPAPACRSASLERRDVVGGAAVTEEFHPGFRNSTASYTVSLLAPQVIARAAISPRTGLRSSSARSRISCRCRTTRSSRSAAALAATQAEVAEILAARRAAAARRTTRCSSRVADVLRELLHVTPPNVGARRGGRIGAGARRVEDGEAVSGARPRGPARRARPLHQERGRNPRSLVRVGDPIKAAFGFDAVVGNFAEPLRAGLGVRAAASRVRRSERQARPVGPRARRHGRDHAGDGDGVRRARRRDPHGVARCDASIVEGRARRRRRARQRRDRSRRRASSPT